jgi:hypothetical protein
MIFEIDITKYKLSRIDEINKSIDKLKRQIAMQPGQVYVSFIQYLIKGHEENLKQLKQDIVKDVIE